jgi:alpha-N-arabinofuranosidase
MNRIVIDADGGEQKISRHIYGHFAEHLGRCIYEGFWVGEDSPIPNERGIRKDAVAALKKLNIPNIRWPGGCFADIYHWKDGVGPKAARPEVVNVLWGGVTENNHFGTHEYYDLCELLGTEPYICGNVGSGTVREMAEWLEYITMGGRSPMADLRRANGRQEPWEVKYWGVGNENWGCGGNMTPLQYAYEYRRYQTYCRHFGGKQLYKIACGQWDDWNEVLMREAAKFMDGLSLHYYCFAGNWEKKGAATGFPRSEWYAALKSALGIEEYIVKSKAIMDRYDPQKRVGIVMDEWGAWWDPEPGSNPGFLVQQNTIRDALIAGSSLHIFHRHADRIHMANIAQTVNVLQAMLLTEGPKMILTPTYHVFEMFKVHHDALLLPSRAELGKIERDGAAIPGVSASASKDGDGKIHLSLCNMDTEEAASVSIEVRGLEKPPRAARGRILNGSKMDSHNAFDRPDEVSPKPFEAKVEAGRLVAVLPPMSVAVLEIEA